MIQAMQIHKKSCISYGILLTGLLLSLLFPAQAVTTNRTAPFKLSDVIPDGKCTLEIMTVQYSERAKELAAKIQLATSTNGDWFLDFINKSPDGPLPYDERLGLTKDEYAEYKVELKKRSLTSTGIKLQCVFMRYENTLSIYTLAPESPLNKIKINLETGELITSAGGIGKPEWINNDGNSGVFGAYEGYAWDYEKSDLAAFDIRTIKLHILRQKPSDQMIWYFQDSRAVNKDEAESYQIIFKPTPIPREAPINSAVKTSNNRSNSGQNYFTNAIENILGISLITSALAVPIAAILSLFRKTKKLAEKIGFSTLWIGSISITAMTALLLSHASREEAGFKDILSLIRPILLTALAPSLALFLYFWLRRKSARDKDIE